MAPFDDQYAFRPTGSTNTAIIAILHIVTDLLERNKFVRVIGLDFSKAFDSVRHQQLFRKMENLNIPGEIYNWLLDVFTDHEQQTKVGDTVSPKLKINAGVIQGSAVGPAAFSILASDLKAANSGNLYIKYADDSYLIIPECNIQHTDSELEHLKNWSIRNNLHLNENKSKEIIFVTPKSRTSTPNEIPNIPRVNEMSILGVTVTSKLSFKTHVKNILSRCNRDVYALKIYKHMGLSLEHRNRVFQSRILYGKLCYAIQSWWNFCNEEDKKQLRAFLKRCVKFKACKTQEELDTIVNRFSVTLFKNITRDSKHVLHKFLPRVNISNYNMRSRAHNFDLPVVSSLNKNNFIVHMLFNTLNFTL